MMVHMRIYSFYFVIYHAIFAKKELLHYIINLDEEYS